MMRRGRGKRKSEITGGGERGERKINDGIKKSALSFRSRSFQGG